MINNLVLANKKKRVKIPYKDSDELLVLCKHLCCICEKPLVQIHHIDGNPSNNDPNNLIPLCGTCHNLVEVKVYGVRLYTPRHLEMYREKHIYKYNNFPPPSIWNEINAMKETLYEHDLYINKKERRT